MQNELRSEPEASGSERFAANTVHDDDRPATPERLPDLRAGGAVPSGTNDFFEQTRLVSQIGSGCGMNTENGVWLFGGNAISMGRHWDSIFICSDMQAGSGELYGINPQDYRAIGCCVRDIYIDVKMMIQLCRKQVNPKVNVYCIQTAGYLKERLCAGMTLDADVLVL